MFRLGWLDADKYRGRAAGNWYGERRERVPTKADTNWTKTLKITPGMLSTHNHYVPCTVLYTSTQEKYNKQFVH